LRLRSAATHRRALADSTFDTPAPPDTLKRKVARPDACRAHETCNDATSHKLREAEPREAPEFAERRG